MWNPTQCNLMRAEPNLSRRSQQSEPNANRDHANDFKGLSKRALLRNILDGKQQETKVIHCITRTSVTEISGLR